MHADEANQAVKLGQLIEHGDYRFDPTDHHGPTLYYFAQLQAWIGQKKSLAHLTESDVRMVPAIFGTLGLLLLWLIAHPLGRGTAFWAGLLLALSPPAIYYSRYFIQETLLVTFTLLAWWGGANWMRSSKWSWAVVTGIGVGLMLATKATGAICVLLSLAAVVVAGRGGRLGGLLRNWRAVLGMGVATLIVAVSFYSSWGRNWDGVIDALATFSPMGTRVFAGTSGHEKPWWYYGNLFVFHRTGGYGWSQTVFLLLAVMGGLGARWGGSRGVRALAIYVGLFAITVSLVPYKTPWIVINLVPGLCVLAGSALARWRWPLVVLAGGCVVVELGWQARQAVFLRPADPRNPYAYQHTAPDMVKLSGLVAAAPAGAVKVIGREYWPIPWYLRVRPEVGYWSDVPADCDGVLVIVGADQADAVQARFRNRYRKEMLGLRPGLVMVIFTLEASISP